MKKYIELLKDPRWQKRRLEIMSIDQFTCQICYANHLTLNVHHLIYFPDRNPWEYDDCHLITLCEPCHQKQKGIDIKRIFADLSINNSTAITIGFLLKKIISERVNNPRVTEQAVWSFIWDLYADDLRAGDMLKEFEEYRKQYEGGE